ncbi:MAG: FUSC family protein [Bacteroidetes bacterium]|nr:MAG: FUSC family protein [Bacteroidota bacterium]
MLGGLNIRKELSSLLAMRESNRDWLMAPLSAVCMGVPLLLGLYLGSIQAGLLAGLGGLVIVYLPETGTITNRIVTLLICSFGFMVSFTIGQIASINHLSSVLTIGVFTGIVHWIVLFYKSAQPKSFFFVLIIALSICQPFNLADIPTKVGLIGLGTMFSSVFGLAYIMRLRVKQKELVSLPIDPVLRKNDFANYWEAIILGAFMAIALGVGYLMGLDSPYWIPVSSAAVMQGASRYHIWQRTVQRIVGTFVGLGLCWLLLHASSSIWVIGVFIVVLQLIVELTVVKNYALAVVFITPLAIFLADAANPVINTPDALISLRFIEICVGSLIGAIGGWVLHREQIRYATLKGLAKLGELGK